MYENSVARGFRFTLSSQDFVRPVLCRLLPTAYFSAPPRSMPLPLASRDGLLAPRLQSLWIFCSDVTVCSVILQVMTFRVLLGPPFCSGRGSARELGKPATRFVRRAVSSQVGDAGAPISEAQFDGVPVVVVARSFALVIAGRRRHVSRCATQLEGVDES